MNHAYVYVSSSVQYSFTRQIMSDFFFLRVDNPSVSSHQVLVIRNAWHALATIVQLLQI